ncbi:MAG TPA: hypothetical protein VJR29_14450, partial [bacterium]|nr:hypothetical protein [bacterium]
TIGLALPFGAELSTFVLTGHGGAAGGRDWASAAVSLGLLKFSGGLSQNLVRSLPKSPTLPPILGATSLVGGLFAAHRLEQHLGWREKTDAGTALFESVSAAASLSLGAKLAHRLLGPGYTRTLAELEFRLRERQARPTLPFPAALAMAGDAKLPGLFMSAPGDGFGGGGGGGKAPTLTEDLIQRVKRMGQEKTGIRAYLLVDFKTQLSRLKPQEMNHFFLVLDRLVSVAQPKDRAGMLPAWWQTLDICGPAEFQGRVQQYQFWLKQMPADEVPTFAKSLIESGDKIAPEPMGKMAALSLKRTLVESRRGFEDPTWVLPLYERLGKAGQNTLLKNLRQQLASEEIGMGRKAVDLLNMLAPQLGPTRLIAWARGLLDLAPSANPLMQGAIWKSFCVMLEQIPAGERRKLLPALRKSLTADYGLVPPPFFFEALGKSLAALEPTASNLLAREVLLNLPKASPGMVKGVLIRFYDHLELLSPQNRELLIRQLETLFDAADPALRSALLVETSHFRDLWKKLDPIEQATFLHRWERGLAAGDPETILRQAENLLFTSPAFNSVERKIELFLKLEEKAAEATTPQGLRRALARKLQQMGEELLPEEKTLLISSSRSRRPSQNPLPMAGYLLKGLAHPEAPALAEALNLSASDWPRTMPRSVEYLREFAPWQEKVLKVLEVEKPNPRIEPVELDLGKVLPIHHVFRYKNSGDYLKTVEEMRERIFRSLIFDGWRPGQMPTRESLREAMTSVDLDRANHPPFVGAAAPSGYSLLVDGHHRLTSFITLVADGHLPPPVLSRLPFDRVYDHSSQGILDAALDRSELPSYGWKDVLAFHPPSVQLIESLGYVNTLDRAFR